ncbi:MAG: LCP family protein [Clostridia bacterium]
MANEPNFEDINSYTDDTNKKKKKKKKKRNRHIILKTLICFISVILIGAGGLSLYAAHFVFSELNTTVITKDKEELGITEGTVTVENITNIALFGVDSRSTTSFSGLSDVIMILTIDEIHNTVKMSSILRDSRVYMGDDYSWTSTNYDKINHAYSYGGAEYAIKVINQNFNLDIEDYITVNFAYMADIVDYFGGVDIDITSDEAYYINVHLISGSNVSTAGGMTHLTGAQAVSFARNRTIGGDEARAERQRKVLEELILKIQETPVTDYPTMISELSYMVELSLDATEILAFTPFVAEGFEITSASFPDTDIDDAYTDIFENSASMWSYDLEAAAERMKEFIYEGAEGTEITYD